MHVQACCFSHKTNCFFYYYDDALNVPKSEFTLFKNSSLSFHVVPFCQMLVNVSILKPLQVQVLKEK